MGLVAAWHGGRVGGGRSPLLTSDARREKDCCVRTRAQPALLNFPPPGHTHASHPTPPHTSLTQPPPTPSLQDAAQLGLRQCCDEAVKRLAAAVDALEAADTVELSTAVAAFEVGVTYLVGSGWHGAEAGRQVCRRGDEWAGCNVIIPKAHGWEPCEVGVLCACCFRALPCLAMHAWSVLLARNVRNNYSRNHEKHLPRPSPPLQEHGEEEEAEMLYDCRVALARLRALQLLDGGVAGSEAAHDALNRLLEVGGVACAVLCSGVHTGRDEWDQAGRAAAMQDALGAGGMPGCCSAHIDTLPCAMAIH